LNGKADRREATMKAIVTESDEGLVFRLDDVAPEQRGLLEADYFTPDGDGYVMTHARSLPHVEQAAANFVRYAGQVYEARLSGSPHWRDGLRHFLNTVDGAGLEWFLHGSASLAVRGLPIVPAGIDVMFPHASDLVRVRDLFAADTLRPLTECEGWVCKAFGTLFHGCEITVAFEPQDSLDAAEPIDSGRYAASHLETIEWEGWTIPVPPLQLLLNINRRRGREERARLIEEWMARG
jgi:hypothetical protein